MLWTLFYFHVTQSLALGAWGLANGTGFLRGFASCFFFGPLLGGLYLWWQGRLQQRYRRWPSGEGEYACIESGDGLYCQFRRTQIGGAGPGARRQVYWQLPSGPPPEAGWPVVFMFQGTGHPARLFFGAPTDAPYGGLHQVRAVRALLDAGFAVVAPDAWGGICWMTNLFGFRYGWRSRLNPDVRFLEALFEAVRAGGLGSLDPNRWYAAGLSSGGYMASRMAVEYPTEFRAICVMSAGYASWSGRYGRMVKRLPDRHPPTLFIHGRMDRTTPFERMLVYRDRLAKAGVPTDVMDDPAASHACLAGAGERMAAWFNRYA